MPHGVMAWEWRKLSAKIFARDEYTCVYCGRQLVEQDCTIDHVVPYKHGGSNYQRNLVTCCQFCNERKSGSIPPIEVLRWVAPYVGYPKKLREITIGYFLRKGFTADEVLNGFCPDVVMFKPSAVIKE